MLRSGYSEHVVGSIQLSCAVAQHDPPRGEHVESRAVFAAVLLEPQPRHAHRVPAEVRFGCFVLATSFVSLCACLGALCVQSFVCLLARRPKLAPSLRSCLCAERPPQPPQLCIDILNGFYSKSGLTAAGTVAEGVDDTL